MEVEEVIRSKQTLTTKYNFEFVVNVSVQYTIDRIALAQIFIKMISRLQA